MATNVTMRHKCVTLGPMSLTHSRSLRIQVASAELRNTLQPSGRVWLTLWLEKRARSRSVPHVSAREWITPWLEQKTQKRAGAGAVGAAEEPEIQTSGNGAGPDVQNGATPTPVERKSARAWIRPWLLQKQKERSEAVLDGLRDRMPLLSRDEEDKAIARLLARKAEAAKRLTEETMPSPFPSETAAIPAPEKAPPSETKAAASKPEPEAAAPVPPEPEKSPYEACWFEPDGSAVYTAEALAKRDYKEVLEACWFSPDM